MAALYVETSALGRVLMEEPDAQAILDELARFEQHVASRLLAVELSRLALRTDRLDLTAPLLAGVALIPLTDALLAAAATMTPANVGTLDAIHLATALSIADEAPVVAMMTYDTRLAQAARQHGLTVIAPA